MKKIIWSLFISITLVLWSATGWSATVNQLEQRLNKLEKKLNSTRKRLKNAGKKSKAENNRLKINGFMSVGGGYVSEREIEYADLNHEVEFQSDSVFGLQTQFKVDDKTDFVGQLVARGGYTNDVAAEWAFLRYKVKDDLTVRAGRLRLPFYLVSESLEVGSSYPWIRPPVEVYGPVPITAYEGMDALYDFSVADVLVTSQLFAGTGKKQITGLQFKVDKVVGLSLQANYNNFTFRTAYSGGDFFATPETGSTYEDLDTAMKGIGQGSLSDRLKANFGGIGMIYDNGKALVMAEATELSFDKGIFSGSKSSYVTAGYRMGNFLPYVTYAESQPDDDSQERIDTAVAAAEAASAGLTAAAGVLDTTLIATFQGTLDATNRATAVGVLTGAFVGETLQAAGALEGLGMTTSTEFYAAANAGLIGTSELSAISSGLTTNAANLLTAAGPTGIGGQASEQRSYAFGIRYDFTPRVALKFEAMKVFDIDEEYGFLGTKTEGSTLDKFNVFSFAIDATF